MGSSQDFLSGNIGRSDPFSFLPRGRKPEYLHPYEDLASTVLPKTIRSALEWAKFIGSTTGPVRSATQRVVAYCITEPEIEESNGKGDSVGREVRDNYATIFSDAYLQVKKQALLNGLDLQISGNAFVSMAARFTRFMTCPGHKDGHMCGVQIPLKEMLDHKQEFGFQFKNMEFCATCPYCGYQGPWEFHDQYSKCMEDLFIKRWNPLEMDLIDDPFAKNPAIIWKIPQDYIQNVRKGSPEILQTIPSEILQAIKEGGNFRFNEDAILHLKTEGLASMDMKGWGLPGIIANFRQAWLFQTCNRHTETMAMEALSPLRVVSPPAAGGAGDPVYSATNLAMFRNLVGKAIDAKRKDPSSWFVTPFPVQYQACGGDAAQFLPRDLLDYSLDTLLTSLGVPVEMYKGSMTLQSAPVALRLFTSYWESLVTDLNTLLQFLARRVSEALGWEPVKVKFAKITQADDINRQVQALQLMSTGAISQTTALSTVGIDKKEEVRRALEEQRDEAEQQSRMQKEMETTRQLDDMLGGGVMGALNRQQQMQAGPMGMPGQNMPVQGGQMAGAQVPGATGAGMASLMPGMDPVSQMIAQSKTQFGDSIEDTYARAQTLAQQMMVGNTASNLRKLKQQDPDIHPIVKGLVEQIRSNAASQGRDMMLQQQYGGPM